MPGRRRFSPDELQAAALEIVDAHGLDGLTMRALAETLGTGAMTIYNYVDGREGLEALIVDAVLGSVDLPDAPTDDWRVDLATVCEAHWRAVRSHPGVVPLLLTRRSHDPASLRVGEATLEALARSGRRDFSLLVGFRVVTAFVLGFAQAELNGVLSHAHGESADTIIGRIRALPTGDYPNLVQAATTAADSDVVEEFRQALGVVIAGLDLERR